MDKKNEFLQQAHIIITNNDGKVIKYSFTDKNGYFKIEFDSKKGLTLTISYIGFNKLNIDLESSDFSNEVVKREYVLTSDVNLLDEIIVKPENIEQDTISIDISKLNLEDNNKLGEILKKSPNFRLDDDGSITYKGKSIDRILIDGKETFNYQNSIALEKIENRMIEKLQVVNNYRDNFSLDKESPEETVLNIDAKSEFKNVLATSVEGGYGAVNKYEFKGSLMRFSSLFNGFLINNTNNIDNPVFKLREIQRLFGNKERLSTLFAESLNELFDEQNRSENFVSNSNLTLRKQTKKYRINSVFYYINSDRSNDLFSQNTYTNGEQISSYNQYFNHKPVAYLSALSADYIIKANQTINFSFDYDALKKTNKSDILYKEFNAYNINDNMETGFQNVANNHSLYSGLTYSNNLSENLLLSTGSTFYDESIDINNKAANSLSGYNMIEQEYMFNKESFDMYASVRYKIISGINSTVKLKYGITDENLGGKHRRLYIPGVNINIFGNKIANRFTYEASVGLETKSMEYNKTKTYNYHIPFTVRLNYEDRLNRLYFNSYQIQLTNPLENAVDFLKSDNRLILANDRLPLSYSSIFKSITGYSYNNFFLGNSFNSSISYQRNVNQLKEGFQGIDENGIYKYLIMTAPVSEEYKFATGASKIMFRYAQFPVVSDLDINYSHIKSPIYISDKFHYAQNNVYSLSLRFQSISKYAINCETGVT
ncbi:MAG: carboxypeptidase-like regulatory domain-containing protein, partial [Prevotellaceae bacterium]|nr:carboxypeptidase-like regulatory domain-containing protein [Prevotellaceae bacterium]